MLQEIQSAEEWIEGFFADWDSRMERYKGPAWRPGGVKHGRAGEDDEETFDRENFAQEWVANYSSHLVLGNPRVRMTTSRSGDERTIVKAHELAENRWIRETNMRALDEKLAVDFGFHRFVCLTLPSLDETDSDKDDMKGWPSAKRISPRKSYVYDTAAIDKEEELWRGHKSIHQKHELLERARANPDEGWDIEEIQALTEEYRVEEVRGGERGRGSAPKRNEVVLYSIWMRDYKPTRADRTFHGSKAWDRQLRRGAWLTLGVVGGKRSRWLRQPFPYWGHPRGPYVVCDGYYVPDEAVGLAQIIAIDAEVQELNLHVRAESYAMSKFKNGVFVDGSDPEFMDKVQMFEDQFVVGIDGLDDVQKKVMPIQFGGSTPEHRIHNQMLRDRVTRRGGITDVQRGQTDPNVTATADQLADQGSQNRVGFIASKFIAGIREILDNVSVYLAFGESKTRLGPEARRSLKDPQGRPAEDVVYNGGISSKEEADWFFSLGIEIEPYSMGQTSEALEQQRVLQMMNTIAVLLPMMAQFPFVMWDDLIETLGEMLNMPNLSDFFDPQALEQFQQLTMQGNQIQAQQGGGKPQPRLAQDVSRLQGGRPAQPMNGNLLGALLAATQRSNVNGAA
jgi:hypothetical protein